MVKVPNEEPIRKDSLISIASGARLLMDHSRPTIPASVAGSQRTVVKRTRLLSLLSPERNPGRKRVPETQIRMAYLMERLTKLKKKQKKAKKAQEMCERVVG